MFFNLFLFFPILFAAGNFLGTPAVRLNGGAYKKEHDQIEGDIASCATGGFYQQFSLPPYSHWILAPAWIGISLSEMAVCKVTVSIISEADSSTSKDESIDDSGEVIEGDKRRDTYDQTRNRWSSAKL